MLLLAIKLKSNQLSREDGPWVLCSWWLGEATRYLEEFTREDALAKAARFNLTNDDDDDFWWAEPA